MNRVLFNSVPGINQENMRKYLEKSVLMAMRHLDKERASIQSTKKTLTATTDPV